MSPNGKRRIGLKCPHCGKLIGNEHLPNPDLAQLVGGVLNAQAISSRLLGNMENAMAGWKELQDFYLTIVWKNMEKLNPELPEDEESASYG